jgi:osmoprotectant transport system permease protein
VRLSPNSSPLSWNPVTGLLSLLAAGAIVGMPFVRSAPNRMMTGEPIGLWQMLITLPSIVNWLMGAVLLLCLLTSVLKASRVILWLQVCAACASVVLLLAVAGAYAQHVALTQSAISRTSLGGAFWVVLILAWLMAADALQRLGAGLLTRVALLATVLAVVMAMLASGAGDALSIMKEHANRADTFAAAVLRHLQIVLIALVPTLCIGLPLGWWAHREQSVNAAVFPVLNIIQTVPSIALFGLLMAPLALLAATYPQLARAGISGVGMAPGVIALVLYSLLPVVRGTLAGLQQVPQAVVDTAQGMGMSPLQIAVQVQLPLALPVLLSGIQTATIAAIGMATITALIGAGGLGAIMFEGLFSSAQDLVLLGVVPIVGLAVLADALFKLAIALLQTTPQITQHAMPQTVSLAP